LKYAFFISYATTDSELAEEIASRLMDIGYPVWFDNLALRVGDSIREKIDRGLSESRHGIVILTKSFFERKWPKRELAALVARHSSEHKIIPILHNLVINDLLTIAPTLADLKAVDTQVGLDEVIKQVCMAVPNNKHVLGVKGGCAACRKGTLKFVEEWQSTGGPYNLYRCTYCKYLCRDYEITVGDVESSLNKHRNKYSLW